MKPFGQRYLAGTGNVEVNLHGCILARPMAADFML